MAHDAPLATLRASPEAQPGLHSDTQQSLRPSRLGRVAAWLLGLAVLALVFALYAHPTLRVALAELVWACFN
jgi:hypothetical protein